MLFGPMGSEATTFAAKLSSAVNSASLIITEAEMTKIRSVSTNGQKIVDVDEVVNVVVAVVRMGVVIEEVEEVVVAVVVEDVDVVVDPLPDMVVDVLTTGCN